MQSICLEPCLAACDELDYCAPLALVEKAPDSVMHTWMPIESEIVFLIKTKTHTLFYLPRTDMLHYAHPSFSLCQQCAEHTVLLSQFVIDCGTMPRLLVFDIARDGNRCMRGVPATERYRILQERAHEALQQPKCFMQWVGELSALEGPGFLSSLPHKVQGFLTLTDDPRSVFIRKF
jgi:hypothetical protein